MVDRERLLEDEAAGCTLLRASLEEIPDERWGDGSITPEGWTPVTVLVHVAGWLDDCGRVLEAIAAGTFDPDTDEAEDPGYVERANAAHGVRAAAMTRSEAEVVLAAARRRATEAFAALPEVTPAAWSWFEESGPMHYAKHVHDLTAWLDGTQGHPEVGRALQAETDAWVPFAVLLEAVPDDRRAEPGPDGWTVVDAVHHLARWMEMAATGIRDNGGWRHEGEPDEDRTIDGLNERFLAESAETSYDVARLRLEEARTALRNALAGLASPSDLALETFVDNTVDHYAEHEPTLRWLSGGAGTVP
ncbi:MAG TPA: maleylpyruvate isomerase N-terminal domain-containing protein [Actinomycetota bacterium]